MTKAYVLIYDTDNGSREDCNIFYSPIEVFADPETRQKRIEFIEANAGYDIGFREEDLDLMTDHLFDIPENLLPYDDDDDEEDDSDDDEDEFGEAFAKSRGALADTDEDLKPVNPFAEYIFAVGLADDAWDNTEKVTTVYVAKREDFENSGALAADSLPIRMPWGFGEIDSGRYEYDGSIVVAKQLLIDLGMQEHDAFADYCSTAGLEVDRDFVNRVSTTPGGDLSIDMSGMVGPNGELDVNGFAQLAASLFDQSTKKG